MTARPLPAGWADLPRDLRDAVLGRLVARRLGAVGAVESPRLARADRTQAVPVSLEQAFILKQQRRFGGRVAWTIAAPPLILDDLDAGAMQRAVARLTRRHDALHMTIHEEGGRFFQVLDPEAPAPLRLTTLPLSSLLRGAEGWIRRRYDAMLAEPFDPETGPLWRAELISRGDRGVLLLTFCSLIADGESLYLIEADLRALYEAECSGTAADVPAADRLDYADYAASQDSLLADPRFATALAWWHERLAGGPPAAWADGRQGIGLARLYEQVLGPETGRALDAYAAAHRTTPPVVLLTEFMRLLRGLDGSDDLWLSSATVARDLPGTPTMVGTFARLVPLRFVWPADGDPLAGVQATLVEAMDQPSVPHVILHEMLSAADPAAPTPFRYIFNHRQVGEAPDEAAPVDVAFEIGPKHAEAQREEDILMMVLQSGSQRRLHWYLRTDRFGPRDAEDLLRAFHAALRRRIGG